MLPCVPTKQFRIFEKIYWFQTGLVQTLVEKWSKTSTFYQSVFMGHIFKYLSLSDTQKLQWCINY